jgi:hypothetical protein
VLLPAALRAREWSHRRRFEAAVARPEAAQRRLLLDLLASNAETAFGRAHGFASVRDTADYARQVPVQEYEGFRPYVRRVVAGEPRVLTAEPPFMFTTTSGTTGEPKLIPVTASWRDDLAALMRLWTRYALRDHPRMFDHQVLTVVSPAVESATETGLPCGAMSGVAYQRLPWLIRRRRVLPYWVALLKDYETRYFVATRLALGARVSSVGTPNPSTLLRLAETAGRRAEELMRAVHYGMLGVSPDVEAEATRAAGAQTDAPFRLRPDPGRAAELARILARHGRLVLRDCWPDLQLAACWLGGNAGIQARRLPEHYGADVPLRDLGLIASEGRLTIPMDDGSAAGVLAVHSVYFEFVPEERIDETTPPTLRAHELIDGQRYYVILTGRNGLYRYDLNDIVEVRGFYRGTPKVAFVRKGRDMVSITGEKLHLNQVEAALRAAEGTARLEVCQFRVIPDIERSRYDLLVELVAPGPARGALAAFLGAFDGGLAALNVEYAAKRASARLAAPRLVLMRAGWAERLCRAEFRRGRREYQHKWAAIRHEWDEASRAEVLDTLEPVPASA